MSASKQESSLTSGRVQQKKRTRRALVEAAREIVRQGRALTIAEVAEVAQVSPATAYRYFSGPEDLVHEIAVAPLGEYTADLPADPADRIATVIDRICDVQFADQAMWRAMTVVAQQRWFAQQGVGGEERVPIRSQSRQELARTALEPLDGVLAPEVLRKLTNAIVLVYGVEAMISTFDISGLEPDEARAVMQWSARSLLQAALAEADASSRPDR